MSQKLPTTEHQEPQNDKAMPLDQFLKELEGVATPEEKLKRSIDFMQQALSQPGTPYFKGFWEVRKHIFPIFKEPLPPPVREQLWGHYIDLTREGRRLKNILDEESSFAEEQIDMAIQALETEVEAFQNNPQSIADTFSFHKSPKSLEENEKNYTSMQRKLNALNVIAARVNGLRKELIKTGMRVRQKNKFFERLSKLGDTVFPQRKELIKEVSAIFEEDVGQFVERHFSEKNFSPEAARHSVFFFREEIKAMQSIAKALTLNTHAFSSTRVELSKCWDQLRGMEKELKKEFALQKQESSENAEALRKEIEAFQVKWAGEELSFEEGMKALDAIQSSMRGHSLTRHDVQTLKGLLKEARLPLDVISEEREAKRKEKEAEFEKARLEKNAAFKERVETLLRDVADHSVEEVLKELEELKKELAALSINKVDRQQLDRMLKGVRDSCIEKQEMELLSLPDNERAVLDQLSTILLEKKNRRREIKEQLEEYRKIVGGSGLDFEKAMKYNELIVQEKSHLEKCDAKILELEQKVQEVRKRT